ncbi:MULTISPECIES: DnaJ C-terminal domain-containing protein [unclassified Aureimonas]|uniref:DnaJ C-terminal domain-containing protein n=1 Tax=unclassified Aureimonas TaxID=2615206 RepID=UPI0006F6E93C|nr:MULTISPECIES: DnaJ C-terminal domain-containing protein [unclassified Aureimonas]KQT65107.1 molecular chaperone DnaJ [Aureimonas sp. Leaf427]KQT76243.1 molecular chaperone DnaJ [Aureimonas sp. Leaf460]
MRDPYAVLGVAKSASEKDIKSAFRQLAKKYHPDANANDASASARFNEANQAYEILGDKDKRAQFDRGEIDGEGKPKYQGFPGQGPFGGGGAGGGRGPAGFDFRSQRGGAADDGGEGMFSDFFEQAFGGRGGGRAGFSQARTGQVKGEDIRATLKVRLEDIVSKDKVEAIFPTGKRLAINLPDGVENGQVIRLRGQGQPAPFAGGTPGDALVTIDYVAHPRFEVAGRDLTLDLPVPVETAVLGGKVPVETLDGRISLSLAPWSNSGRTLRLKGKGLTRTGGGRGDILANIRIVLPKDPDPSLVEFFRAKVEPAEG